VSSPDTDHTKSIKVEVSDIQEEIVPVPVPRQEMKAELAVSYMSDRYAILPVVLHIAICLSISLLALNRSPLVGVLFNSLNRTLSVQFYFV
jgi:hypothetical protein